MIRFDMKCTDGHVFEGWFGSSADYEDQRTRGLLTCPVCGDDTIQKAPMAPNVASRKDSVARPRRDMAEPVSNGGDGSMPDPDAVMASGVPGAERMVTMLRQLRRFVETHADNVGDDFADEARRIHSGEAEERGIYGNATPEEVEDLRDDGIEVASIPWLRNRDH